MRISGLTHAAFAPALLRFAIRVATHAQGWLPAGWLAFTGRASNPLDHYERFQFTWSSPFPVLLTLLTFQCASAGGGGCASGVPVSVKQDLNTMKFGFNYHFNWGAPPGR